MKSRNIKKILLLQPNYAWLNKRTLRFPTYTLALLKACLDTQYETTIFDPNFNNLSEDEVFRYIKKLDPNLVGITSNSTEYLATSRLTTSITRRALPNAIIVLGGVMPTVLIEEAMKDENVDYWIMGEGEYSFPHLINELQNGKANLSNVNGLAYWKDGKSCINKKVFIENLDNIPFPVYSNIVGGFNEQTLSLHDYGNVRLKYDATLYATNYPFAYSITSRGCPFRCVFCAGRTVSGRKVRFRSAENVLAEIDSLYNSGIREIIFLDDHFLANKKRALDIMNGIIDRKYNMTCKCSNVTAWLLDEELLETMHNSGCNFITASLESGNQYVVDNIIKKPVKLKKIHPIFNMAKSIGFDIVVNFIIGFPGETWDQIRDTFSFAEKLSVDICNFHIATPLPKTELMDVCLRESLLPEDFIENFSKYSGFGKGLITTNEFTPFELEILRSFEWDRINFSSEERKSSVARLNGITIEELEEWRRGTRRNIGVNDRMHSFLTRGENQKSNE